MRCVKQLIPLRNYAMDCLLKQTIFGNNWKCVLEVFKQDYGHCACNNVATLSTCLLLHSPGFTYFILRQPSASICSKFVSNRLDSVNRLCSSTVRRTIRDYLDSGLQCDVETFHKQMGTASELCSAQ